MVLKLMNLYEIMGGRYASGKRMRVKNLRVSTEFNGQ